MTYCVLHVVDQAKLQRHVSTAMTTHESIDEAISAAIATWSEDPPILMYVSSLDNRCLATLYQRSGELIICTDEEIRYARY